MKSELFANLSDVTFAEKDAATIESEIITRYEEYSQRVLARGDPVRLLLDTVILALIQQRNIIDIAAKNNLLAYASGSYLDHIGALLGVTRLDAGYAVCTVRFTLSEVLAFPAVIPEGTRITAGDGITFSTCEEGVIASGERECELLCRCDESGDKGNGYVAGQIRRIVDVFPYEMSAVNIDAPSGGSDIESDENYRERIQIAPESFTSAGPVNAYAYFARSAHPDIIDVAVMGPPDTEPGHVEIYPLMSGGVIPSDEVIAQVYRTCNASDVRPDTDYVHVLKPGAVKYAVSVRYWVNESDSAKVSAIDSAVREAVSGWEKWQRVKLGRDINPSKLTALVMNAGAKRCEISSPGFVKILQNQIAVCENESVICEGTEEA